ncbi:MAG: hypothetical protein JNK79_06925 [Chitinophagaceae bacterium]|nr:hypothetical protein [Chitinophagaceae bacterium]
MKKLCLLLLFAGAGLCSFTQQKKIIILTEQSQNRIVLVDTDTDEIIWDWRPEESNIKPGHVEWFNAPDDAKSVYSNQYILITASGGGVALIRIADKKAVFYAYAGGNPHSAELLPDGNIVCASSTGNFLTLFKVDSNTVGENTWKKTIPIAFGHNVVWDKKHKLLWSAAMDHIKSFRYNFSCNDPALTLVDSLTIPGTEAHDLFPDFGTSALWLTNPTDVYRFDVNKKTVSSTNLLNNNIKSVSSGPSEFPTIVSQPKEQWWTDEVLDGSGNSVFRQPGLKIYKARWLLVNTFSYGQKDKYRQCVK